MVVLVLATVVLIVIETYNTSKCFIPSVKQLLIKYYNHTHVKCRLGTKISDEIGKKYLARLGN